MWFCWQCGSRYPIHREWCSVCQQGGTILVEPLRPATALRSQLQAASARDLVGRSWSMVESRAYPELLVSRGALVAVWGQPGSGKSTLATRYVDQLPGPVVYFSAEEKLGPTVAARLQRCAVTRAGFHVVAQAGVDELCAFCRSQHAVALVIDSVAMTTVRPEDLRRLLEAAAVAVLLYVLHATKANEAAGSNAYLHEADVVLAVAGLLWRVEKSRYQPADALPRPVLPPP